MSRIALLACAISLAAPACAQQMISKADRQWEGEGEYVVFASPWCSDFVKSLQQGRDYANTMRWQKGSLPNNVEITWRFPEPDKRPQQCGVFGYNFVGWGNYHNSTPRKSIPSRQIKNISELRFDYGIEVTGDPQKYGILAEFFLTRDPGHFGYKRVEVGFLPHVPRESLNFWKTQRQLGTFKDRWLRTWIVAQSKGGIAGSYVVFIPTVGTRMTGNIDAIGALRYLKAQNVISENWFFNGAAIGVEPLGGQGYAKLRYFRPTYR